MEKDSNFLWHVEGYLYDVMLSLSRVPETLISISYVQQLTEVVGALPQYLSDSVLNSIDKAKSNVLIDYPEPET